MRTRKLSGIVLAAFLSAAALLHVYWAIGGTWALRESIGEGNPVPPLAAIWLVVIGLAIAAAGILGRIRLWGAWIPAWIFRAGTWLLCTCLAGATILNASTGRSWETYLIAPICGVLAILCFVVAREPHDEGRGACGNVC